MIDPSAFPIGTQAVPQENMPAFASLWVTAEPEVLELAVEVELRATDSNFAQPESFGPGERMRASFGVSSGRYRLIGDGGACTVEIVLPPEREVDVVMRPADDAPCEFEKAREHGAEFLHEASGTLTARVTVTPRAGLLVAVRSVSEPMNPVPDAVPPDEGGLAIVGPLWPGRYEVRLLRGDEMIESVEVTIRQRDPAGDLVEITLDGLPD